MSSTDKWDRRYMEMAELIASWSKDPSTQVGAVMVSHEGFVTGMGYNGFPRGVDDALPRLMNRDEKYPRTVHAEMNALIAAGHSSRGATLYCTLMCCGNCAGSVIQSGVRRFVTWSHSLDNDRWIGSFLIASQMFEEAGVKVHMLGRKS